MMTLINLFHLRNCGSQVHDCRVIASSHLCGKEGVLCQEHLHSLHHLVSLLLELKLLNNL